MKSFSDEEFNSEEFQRGMNKAIESDLFDRLIYKMDLSRDLNSLEERGYQHGLTIRPHISDLLKGLEYVKPENSYAKKAAAVSALILLAYLAFPTLISAISHNRRTNEQSKPRLEKIIEQQTTPTNDYITPQKSLNTHY